MPTLPSEKIDKFIYSSLKETNCSWFTYVASDDGWTLKENVDFRNNGFLRDGILLILED
jgi:hypothetical protein